MRRIYGTATVGICLVLGSVPGAHAQYVVDYPPATGYFTAVPPSYPAPGVVGASTWKRIRPLRDPMTVPVLT